MKDRQANRETGIGARDLQRQTGRQTDRETDRQADKQTEKERDTHTPIYRER